MSRTKRYGIPLVLMTTIIVAGVVCNTGSHLPFVEKLRIKCSPTKALDISENNKYFCFASQSQEVSVCNLDGTFIKKLALKSRIRILKMSKSADKIAVYTEDGDLHIWNLANDNLLLCNKGKCEIRDIKCVSFSEDDKYLAFAGLTLMIYGIESERCISNLDCVIECGDISQIIYLNNNTILCDGTFRAVCCSILDNKIIYRIPQSFQYDRREPTFSIAYFNQTQLLYTIDLSGDIISYNALSGAKINKYSLSSSINNMPFIISEFNDCKLLIGHPNGYTELCDPTTLKKIGHYRFEQKKGLVPVTKGNYAMLFNGDYLYLYKLNL